MAISRDDVLHVSRLARLQLNESEIEKFTLQLGSILEYISSLDELDTEGVPPTAHVLEITNVFRDDVVSASPIEGMEQMAPDFSEGHFRVPKVIE
jgi:aspartyl-tRNA(Asn)/glutamyl-tRNA(Gln) amidotransferase subunit C